MKRPSLKMSTFRYTTLIVGSSLLLANPAYAFLDAIFGKKQNNTTPKRPTNPVVVDTTKVPPTGAFGHLAKYGAWNLKFTSWSDLDEKEYSDFVRAIGRSGCRTVDSCIRSEANPYRHSDPPKELFTFWSDCADWPYFLRSYFAWKVGLPMAYSHGMKPVPLNAEQQASIASGEKEAQNDVRYSWNGNLPSGRVRVPYANRPTNYFEVHNNIQNTVHTATMRVDPSTDYGDMYTPAVFEGAIRPGTAVYDPSGHVGVVYDITADGQVMVFDALIDRKSISPRRAYSGDFYKRSKMEHGGWFQNFRPVVVDNAVYDRRTDTYSGGTMRLLTNYEILDYSLEMFGESIGPGGKKGYMVDGKFTDRFQEFLRRRMFRGQYKLDVVKEFRIRMNGLCEDFGSRVSLVQDGTTKGIAARPHDVKLPDTVYGGHGDWDLYSTPGGDVRRRISVPQIIDYAKDVMAQVRNRNAEYSYNGGNLKADLIATADSVLKSCSITYQNTAGRNVTLNLDNLLKRMPLMSFSPWHCIELRWGATSQQELASCPDLKDENKMRWYRAQQTLRNQMARDTNIFTGFTLEQLEQKASSLGPAKAENFDLIKRMQSEL